jgi:hypothetical protein
MNSTPTTNDLDIVVSAFSNSLAGVKPTFHVKERPDGSFLVFEFASPHSRFFQLLDLINDQLPDDNNYKNRVSISARPKKPVNVLDIPETSLLLRELSASLTVDRNTFGEDFLSRYTPSVTHLEKEIIVPANHIVYGRRGSGKSSLLAYAMHKFRLGNAPYCWVAMQTYFGRTDRQAIASVLSDIFSEAAQKPFASPELAQLANELLNLGELDDEEAVANKLARMVPRMRRGLASVSSVDNFTIFLDDIHVLGYNMQPELLSFIYSLTRGNRAYIKVSGIEQFTNLWDGNINRGLEPPHDIQTLKLDHNLTNPDQSKSHIKSILDKHAVYCGLPKIEYLASEDHIDRLVLSAAAVPRDALSLFSKSISKSLLKGRKSVSITSLNAAASDAIEEKLKDVRKDAFDVNQSNVAKILQTVKDFCSDNRKNAFLIKIDTSNETYNNVQRLIAHRFVHVLHEGITPHRAGERYEALMLDYGFFIGIRTARSMTLVPDTPRQLAAKELRLLPILPS